MAALRQREGAASGDNVRGQQAARKQRKVFGCLHMPAKYRRREHIEVPQFEMEWNNDKK
jgi:hypothetical protein